MFVRQGSAAILSTLFHVISLTLCESRGAPKAVLPCFCHPANSEAGELLGWPVLHSFRGRMSCIMMPSAEGAIHWSV